MQIVGETTLIWIGAGWRQPIVLVNSKGVFWVVPNAILWLKSEESNYIGADAYNVSSSYR